MDSTDRPGLSGWLKLEAHEQLELPGKSRASIVCKEFVAVVVLVHRRVDDSKVRMGSYPTCQGVAARACGIATIVKAKTVGIGQLHAVKDVENLGAEYSAEAFTDVHLFLEREVKLRDIGGANDAVTGVAISQQCTGQGIVRWRRERGSIDPIV